MRHLIAPPWPLFLLALILLCFFSSGESSPFGEKIKLDTGGLSRQSFPKDFLFGTATSAYQVEGETHQDGRGPSIWDAFVKIPGTIAKNATAELTVDQYHRYKEDVDLMKKLNFDAYRFSISWSRIFPEGTGKINWKGVDYYNRLINYLIQKGITPYANLYHYDLPLALEKKYKGLLDRQVVGTQAKQKGRIGILLDFVWYEPLTRNTHNATIPKELGYQQDWNATFGFAKLGKPIGPRAYSYWLYNVPWGMYKALMYMKERYGNPTMILSENGMDDSGNVTLAQGLHDTTRIKYYKDYLTQLKKAVDDGANVKGYFAWSLLDNFEWLSGYTSRFGIVYVDYKTLKRYPKMSAQWFMQLLKRNKK
ncbi:hypothetical protein Bca4012_090419 [Brassica carinata]